MPHVRSAVEVGGWLSYCPVPQFVSEAQTRFCIELPFAQSVVWYCVGPQVVHALQTRSLVGVGAVVMYELVPQLVSGVQTRSYVPFPFAQAFVSN